MIKKLLADLRAWYRWDRKTRKLFKDVAAKSEVDRAALFASIMIMAVKGYTVRDMILMFKAIADTGYPAMGVVNRLRMPMGRK